jgi:Lhr-like helicase
MITYKQKQDTDDSIFSSLNPIVSNWFKSKFEKFSEPQKFAVLDIQERIF